MTKKMPRNKRFARSSFEIALMEALDAKGVKYKYEDAKIKWVSEHLYTPDICLENGIIVEAKGYFDPEARRKMRLVKEQNPALDIRMVFQRDQPLYKGSKTKYSDWAKKYGFPYSIGGIPDDWINIRNKLPTKVGSKRSK